MLGEYLGAGSGATQVLYHFENNLNDSSGNSRNLTMWTGSVTYDKGNVWQYSANFNGSALAKTGNIAMTAAFTMSAWIKTSSNNVYIMSHDWYAGGNTLYIAIWESTANKINVLVTWPSIWWVWKVWAITVNDWNLHHIAITYRWTGSWWAWLTIYVDGKIDTVFASTGDMNTNSFPFYVWGRVNNALGTLIYHWFVWPIDEVMVENRERSSTEMKKYYTYAKWRFI